MKDKFYVTTPIYYVNWLPHIGHFYSSLIADVIARYNRISWKEVRFTTWVDENSQKAVNVALEKWVWIMDFLDEMSAKHKEIWDKLDINYTDFIRTTEQRHHKLVREVLQTTYDNWDIYEWLYEWMYCVGCEAFKKEEDLVPLSQPFPQGEKGVVMVCPDHLTEPDKIKEKNYFFKLSKYQNWLEELYIANPTFVIPDIRFNEVKEFVKRWLEDFSISRETNKFWIKLPFDETQVTYVWFDALYNYYTSCKYSRWWDKDNNNFIDESDFWPADLHVVWKDIIRFHAIYWPAMLASYFWLWELRNWVLHFKNSDLEKLPKNILTTGYFTADWQKMSKSLWNVIEPVEFSQKYSKDLLTLYLLSTFNIGQDWDFSIKDSILMYNAKLANNLGNLVNRVVVLSLKLDWVLKKSSIHNTFPKMEKLNMMKNYNLKWVLDEVFSFLDNLNTFVTQKEPWQMIKDENKLEETREVLYTVAEWLRLVWLVLYPFFPEKMSEMFTKLWLNDYEKRLKKWELNQLLEETPLFNISEKWENLFNRFEV